MPLVHSLAAAGAAAGLVWGGFGGRIAMRVVFLTSNERVRGVMSDDGFEIGTISGASMFLLIFAAILGGMAGFGVGIIRMVTAGPTWAVAIGTSLAAASFAGAGIVHTDGVDFRLLDPLWLTVGLFVLIPGLWGATVVVVTERLLRSHLARRSPTARPPPLLGCHRMDTPRRHHDIRDTRPRCRHRHTDMTTVFRGRHSPEEVVS